MEQIDVLIVGAATAGSFLARKLAERGHRVLVLEQQPKEKLCREPEIFRVAEADFARYALPLPEHADDFAFSCSGASVFSARDGYPKEIPCTAVGIYRFRYVARLNAWAREAGAEICYQATFVDFIFEEGRVAGVVYEQEGALHEVRAKLVADCSGTAAVARTKLPASYGVERAPVSQENLQYVTLRHVAYHEPKDYVSCMRAWTYYSIWEAQEGRADCAVLGTWSNGSYEAGERVFASFQQTVKLPRYTVLRIERGILPNRHPLNSFVADGFFASGNAAYLTVPGSGIGFTVSMAQLVIAAEEISRVLSEGGELSRGRLWGINARFFRAQGRALAAQHVMQAGLSRTTAAEDDFFYRHSVIFSEQTLSALSQEVPLVLSAKEKPRMALALLGGMLTGKVRVVTIGRLLRCMQNTARAIQLYANYPEMETGFTAWVLRAERFWKKCGSMAENEAN